MNGYTAGNYLYLPRRDEAQATTPKEKVNRSTKKSSETNEAIVRTRVQYTKHGLGRSTILTV